MKDITPLWEKSRDICHIRNKFALGAIGEFWGTFIVGLFTVGAGIQNTGLCDNLPCRTYLPMVGELLGLMIAITIFGGVSGAHVNPAVTLGLAISGKIGWVKVPLYWFMQFLGVYLGGGLGYLLYLEMLTMSIGDKSVSEVYPVNMFVHVPHNRIGIALTDQIIGTAILVMIIHAAVDKRNMKVPKFFFGFLFASTLAGINFAFRVNAGGICNPARDLSIRLLALTIGYPSEKVFTSLTESGGTAHYWLAPFFGPLLGGVVGSFMYVMLAGAHLDEADDSESVCEKFQDPDTNYGSGQMTRNPTQQYGQPKQDWRSTEFIRRDQQMPHGQQQYQQQQPPQGKPPKEQKKKGFGFGDLKKAGEFGKMGMDIAGDFDTGAFENPDFQNIVGAAQTGMDMADAAKQGYDAYQGYRNPPAGGGGVGRSGGGSGRVGGGGQYNQGYIGGGQRGGYNNGYGN